MKSVGEVMAIGRTFPEALNKAIRGLEIGLTGLSPKDTLPHDMSVPTAQRLFQVADAIHKGQTGAEVTTATNIDPWFVSQLVDMLEMEADLHQYSLATLPEAVLRKAKRNGFSDAQIGQAVKAGALEVRAHRLAAGIVPTFQRVDTCAAEFEAHTPYLYSTYESEDEAKPTNRRKVVILGGGPNRIGQGIEFDYCCVQACFALRAQGFETIMINCNPETVSTDYDTADRLYFEPLTLEDVLNVIDLEKPEGVIVQLGGQTPINLTRGLAAAGVPIWGTTPDAIDLAEDRVRFGELLRKLDIPHPDWGTAQSLEAARRVAVRVGYPVMVRPSFVLGGRAMEIVYDDDSLAEFLALAKAASPDGPVLIDHYLEDAFEVDVDALGDGERVVIAGILQHIEEAGIHSGDSACVLPPYKISNYHLSIIRDYTEKLGLALGVKGLMNAQYAIKDDVVYVLEVNPRASRTAPFVSKATGVPIAQLAVRVMAGQTLEELGFLEMPNVDGFFVKEVVLPFKKFPGAQVRLGPEMRSTGEVMGHASRFGHAFAKAEMAAGEPLPTSGAVLITVNDFDKGGALKIARDFHRLGFKLMATKGTAEWFGQNNLPVTAVYKVGEGTPHIVDFIEQGEIAILLNTPLGSRSHADTQAVRAAAIRCNVPLLTTLSAAAAAVNGIKALQDKALSVRSLQKHHHLLDSLTA